MSQVPLLRALLAAMLLSWAPLAIGAQSGARRAERVKPGVSVLLDERVSLLRGRKVALLSDGAAADERGTTDDDLLRNDKRARTAHVELVGALRADRAAVTAASLDSIVRTAAMLIVDLQDIGARPGPTLPLLVEALRCGKRNSLPVVVLDRPNPINGTRLEGPLSVAPTHANDGVYGIPLRHAMTTGELAAFANDSARVGAELTVIPLRFWRRSEWFEETGLRWRAPFADVPTMASAFLFGGVAALQGTNLSVGRGTAEPFQRIGAPWLHARAAVQLLNDRLMAGVLFHEERFTPSSPSDGRFASRAIQGIRVEVTDRDRANPVRIGAALLWAILKTSPDSLRFDAAAFDVLMGAPRIREALLRGEDPDDIFDHELEPTVRFREATRRALLYR